MAAFDEVRNRYRARSFALAAALWLASIPLAYPAWIGTWIFTLAFATLPLHIQADGSWKTDNPDGRMMVSSLAIMAFVFIATPIIVNLFGERFIATLYGARVATDDERPIEDVVESIGIAAGVARVRVLIVDSNAVNAAYLGSRFGVDTVMITSEVSKLPRQSAEALVALALASGAIGGIATGRLLMAASAPLLLLQWALRMAARYWAAVLIGAPVLLLASAVFGLVDDHSWATAAFYPFLFGIFIFFIGPMVAVVWMVTLAVFNGVGSLATETARHAADASAIGLTRNPDPMIDLLQKAKTNPTRPRSYVVGLGPIWVLPTGFDLMKQNRLDRRLRLLEPMGTQVAPLPVPAI